MDAITYTEMLIRRAEAARMTSAAAAATTTTPAAVDTSYEEASDDDALMPWEAENFIPRTASGKQKSPNVIRGELQRYIDQSNETQTSILLKMGVNNNSFRRFMNPKTYKDQWSAVQNSTYWAAARLLEQDRYEKKLAKKKNKAPTAGKRKSPADGIAESAGAPKKSKTQQKLDSELLMARINAVEGVDASRVYDSCPELVKKIKAFLALDGVTKAAFCCALGGINKNSLGPFLMGKRQDQCGNVTYRRAYEFFEKKRIMEGAKKTPKRLKNEQEHPTGFSLEKERAGRWVIGVNPSFYSRGFGGF